MKLFAAGLAILALAFGVPALRARAAPAQAELEFELVCTACHEPLDESTSPIAQQMKAFIRENSRVDGDARSTTTSSPQLGPRSWRAPEARVRPLRLAPAFRGDRLRRRGAVRRGVGARAWLKNKDDPDVQQQGDTAAAARHPSVELRVDQELARFDG